MPLEIRAVNDGERFDLYDGEDRIGEIRREASTVVGVVADPSDWEYTMWSLMGTGKEWSGSAPVLEEVQEYAREDYQEFLAERRELNRSARPNTISVPMGGQRRRR